MNLSQIEESFFNDAEDCIPSASAEVIWQNIKSQIIKLLEDTQLENKPTTSQIHTADLIQMSSTAIGLKQNEGYNQAVKDHRQKIKEALE
jgi:hypothetical protein